MRRILRSSCWLRSAATNRECAKPRAAPSGIGSAEMAPCGLRPVSRAPARSGSTCPPARTTRPASHAGRLGELRRTLRRVGLSFVRSAAHSAPVATTRTRAGADGPRGSEGDAWARVLADYEQHLAVERGLSAHTVRAYLTDLAELAEHARRLGRDDPAEVDLQTLRSWLAGTSS